MSDPLGEPTFLYGGSQPRWIQRQAFLSVDIPAVWAGM